MKFFTVIALFFVTMTLSSSAAPSLKKLEDFVESGKNDGNNRALGDCEKTGALLDSFSNALLKSYGPDEVKALICNYITGGMKIKQAITEPFGYFTAGFGDDAICVGERFLHALKGLSDEGMSIMDDDLKLNKVDCGKMIDEWAKGTGVTSAGSSDTSTRRRRRKMFVCGGICVGAAKLVGGAAAAGVAGGVGVLFEECISGNIC